MLIVLSFWFFEIIRNERKRIILSVSLIEFEFKNFQDEGLFEVFLDRLYLYWKREYDRRGIQYSAGWSSGTPRRSCHFVFHP